MEEDIDYVMDIIVLDDFNEFVEVDDDNTDDAIFSEGNASKLTSPIIGKDDNVVLAVDYNPQSDGLFTLHGFLEKFGLKFLLKYLLPAPSTLS